MFLVEDADRSDFYERLATFANNEVNPIKYLGIDPGKANGFCGYDAKCYLQFMVTVAAEDMVKYLKCFKNVDTCVIENFLLYPNKAKQQAYSEMLTSKVIGRVESWAEMNDVTLVKQGATIKKTAYLWLGKKIPSKSDPTNHTQDAHAHFTYWAIRTGKINATEFVRNRRNIES